MAIGSGIEWTEATWNPATGCSKISPGCANCYAEKLSKRLQLMSLKKYQKGFRYTEHYSEINTPLKWTKPRRIFVNSMSDLFHEHASIDFIRKCFFTMIKAHQHTYQILTKRPEKMRKFSYLFEKELREFSFSQFRINRDEIKKYMETLYKEKQNAIFYASGPPGFVDAMKELLEKIGVKKENIKQDWFDNYDDSYV